MVITYEEFCSPCTFDYVTGEWVAHPPGWVSAREIEENEPGATGVAYVRAAPEMCTTVQEEAGIRIASGDRT